MFVDKLFGHIGSWETFILELEGIVEEVFVVLEVVILFSRKELIQGG